MTLSISLKHLTKYIIVFSRSKSFNARNYRIKYNILTNKTSHYVMYVP